MTNLERLSGEELRAQVDGFFDRLIKSLCDTGGNHQPVAVARDAWLELAKRYAEALGALDKTRKKATRLRRALKMVSESPTCGCVIRPDMTIKQATVAASKFCDEVLRLKAIARDELEKQT